MRGFTLIIVSIVIIGGLLIVFNIYSTLSTNYASQPGPFDMNMNMDDVDVNVIGTSDITSTSGIACIPNITCTPGGTCTPFANVTCTPGGTCTPIVMCTSGATGTGTGTGNVIDITSRPNQPPNRRDQPPNQPNQPPNQPNQPPKQQPNQPNQPPKQQPNQPNQPPKQQPNQPNQPPKQQPNQPNQPPKQQPNQPNQPPKQQPNQPKPVGGGGNAFVTAINSKFSMNLGSESSQDSCAAKHANAEPTLSQAHASWSAGDRCGGGRGEVWAGSSDPTQAAQMWLTSPPHAAIIRAASKLACGAGPSSATCVAY